MERRERRDRLLDQHGFVCHCPKCELTGDALAASESRQRVIGGFLRRDDSTLPVATLLQRIEVRLKLMAPERMPSIWAWKPLLYRLVTASVAELRRQGLSETEHAAIRIDILSRAEGAMESLRVALGTDHATTQFVAEFVQNLRAAGAAEARASAGRTDV